MGKDRKIRVIRLCKQHVCLLVEETKNKNPIEICGLLFGDTIEQAAVVGKIILTRNILESSINFQIDPEEFLNALAEAEKEGMQLIGFFHSHPAPPSPSVSDIKYMKLWPEHIWLVISSVDYSMRAYRCTHARIRKVCVEKEP